MKSISFLVTFFFLLNISNATVRNVPGAYSTISLALAACQPSDTVLVQPGTYTEQITWPTVADIKLLSAGDSSNTIISAGQNGRAISMNSNTITNATVIRGFAIRDGLLLTSSSQGGGIRLNNSSPTLDALHIEQNRLSSSNWNYGAGIYISGGSPRILNCGIRNNFIDSATWGHGCGIYVVNGANVQISNCSIDHNQTTSSSWCYGVGIFVAASQASIVQTRIFENRASDNAGWYYGCGIYAEDAVMDLNNVLIASNTMGINGSFYRGGAFYLKGATSVANLTHVTFAENVRVDGGSVNGTGIYIDSGDLNLVNSISYNTGPGPETTLIAGTLNATYSDVRGGITGTGNINALPQFVSTTDFHLAGGSPCFGTGNPVLVLNDDLEGQPRPLPFASNPDMGCFEADQTVVGNNNPLNPDFYLGPNPATDLLMVTVKNLNGLNLPLFVYDSHGKLVQYQTLSNPVTLLNIQDWCPGVYFLKLAEQSQKIIKR